MAKCRNCGDVTSFFHAGFRQKSGLCLSCYKRAKRIKSGATEPIRYFYGRKHPYFTSRPLHPHFDSGYTLEEIDEMSPEERSGEMTFADIQNYRANCIEVARTAAKLDSFCGPTMLFL